MLPGVADVSTSAAQLFDLTLADAHRKGIDVTDATPPESVFADIEGARLHFLDWQSDAPQHLLLLHGALLNAHVWDLFCLGMRDGSHIRALDLPGHGDSQWLGAERYTRPRTHAFVDGLIHHLDLRSLILVGHSFGGAVAARVAAQMPDRVRALVMVDSTLMPRDTPSMRARAAATPRSFASLEEFASHAAGLNPRGGPGRVSVGLRWNARQLADGRWTWKYDPALLHLPPEATGFDDVWHALRAFPNPILFVRAGKHSHLADAAVEQLQAMPNVRLVTVPDATHNVMSTNPLGFTRAVADFLS
jgi:esterase